MCIRAYARMVVSMKIIFLKFFSSQKLFLNQKKIVFVFKLYFLFYLRCPKTIDLKISKFYHLKRTSYELKIFSFFFYKKSENICLKAFNTFITYSCRCLYVCIYLSYTYISKPNLYVY